ncbi:MAG: DNA-binding protein [bacterium]|nr:MAG: DNA-binding protein [bacterium]
MAKKPMTKTQIISHLADNNELSKKQAKEILESLVELAYKQAKNGFTVPGLGKLVLNNRKARMGRNPQTGEAIKIPAKKAVKLRIAKACKDAVVRGK